MPECLRQLISQLSPADESSAAALTSHAASLLTHVEERLILFPFPMLINVIQPCMLAGDDQNASHAMADGGFVMVEEATHELHGLECDPEPIGLLLPMGGQMGLLMLLMWHGELPLIIWVLLLM